MHTPAGKSAAQQRPRHTPGASPPLSHAAAASPSPVAPAVPSLTFSASKHVRSMRAQKAAGTKQAHSRTLFKPALATPFTMPWNPLSLEQSLQAIKLLQEGLRALPDQSSASAAVASVAAWMPAAKAAAAAPAPAATASASSQKRKRPSDATPATSKGSEMVDVEPPSSADDSSASSSTGLCLGINAVTRGLETGALSLVIVCRSVNPLALIAHLPVLCHLRQCRMMTLHPQINSRMLAQALRQSRPPRAHNSEAEATSSTTAAAPTSAGRQENRGAQVCMALGIQAGALSSTVSALSPFSSLPSLPWLTPVPVVYQPVKVMHTDAPNQRGGGGGGGGGAHKKQQQQAKSKQQSAGAGAAAKNVSAAAPPAASASNVAAHAGAGAKGSAAGAAPASRSAPSAESAAGGGAPAKQRVESATQRRKKQKVEQHQQRAQTPPGQA